MHQYLGPTNKIMNCASKEGNDWANWEEKGSSHSASVCHGGVFNGELYGACPSRFDCRIATAQRLSQEAASSAQAMEARRHHLPVVQQQPSMPAPQIGGLRVIGSTPAARPTAPSTNQYQPPAAPTALQPRGQAPTPTPGGLWPAQQIAGAPRGMFSPPQHAPVPIIPPEMYPRTMQTPYAHSPQAFPMGGITPTFLPVGEEGVVERLAKNVAQGMIGSTGWHVMSLSQSIDFFQKR